MSAPARQAPEKLIRAITKHHSATEAYRVLTGQGYRVTLSQCSTARSFVRSQGIAAPVKRVTVAAPVEPIRPHVEAPCSAKMGSDALLKAQLSTGLHWITNPARFAEACASVGLSA